MKTNKLCQAFPPATLEDESSWMTLYKVPFLRFRRIQSMGRDDVS
jgi:hypothetical protein